MIDDDDTAMILMEYCQRGNLRSFLRRHAEKLTVDDKRSMSAMMGASLFW